jgi:hypothetical protein
VQVAAKAIRDRFGLHAKTEVEFRLEAGAIVLEKGRRSLAIRKWKGRCGKGFSALGYSSVDKFMDDVRGR